MTAPVEAQAGAAVPEWMQRQERGSLLLLQLMRHISLLLGRRLSRSVVYAIALYFLLTAPQARQASRHYLQRALQRRPGWRDLYRHIQSIASTIHDRFYLLNAQPGLFDIQVFGAEQITRLRAQRQQGALLFGAHLGSFEMLLAHSRSSQLDACMAMYPENARQLNRALAAINPHALTGIIALGQVDSMLNIHHQLEHGTLVGVLADRAAGPDRYLSLPFLGAPARFPTGPFRMAALLGHPIFFMTALYHGSNRYTVHFEALADFAAVPRAQRDTVVRETMEKYVATLERHCRAAPYNWFNFFEFWESAP